ncbi:cytochrome c oxidase subunit II [Gorillibacterium massiliense]|uniref:cytochrome c oxidase subunit II n=1 Tax=Gorillibacterium massiliense TaxID=1280390 RepID=UPI000594152C|nr:cytochrome c oxidase subunit II [Gorillibacterium massiliense]
MGRNKSLWRLLPLTGIMALILAGCGDDHLSALKPKGTVAKEQLSLITISLGVMIFVFLVVMAIYIYVLFRYRKRPGDTSIPKQVEGNHLLEIIWTIIPIFLLLVIAVPTIFYTFKHSKDYRDDPEAIHINVTSHQFWWQFEYLDKDKKVVINTAEDLVIPVNKRVVFELSSVDVNHSFWVPSLAGKIDTNAGSNKNTMYIVAEEPGTYKGRCAELCGPSHALMDFKVKAMEQADYDAWYSKMTTPKTVAADVQSGQEIFKDNCMACHATDATGQGFGPNLNNIADREKLAGVLDNNEESLKEWIANPSAKKPGVKMPAFQDQLDDNQMGDLVKYLQTLK